MCWHRKPARSSPRSVRCSSRQGSHQFTNWAGLEIKPSGEKHKNTCSHQRRGQQVQQTHETWCRNQMSKPFCLLCSGFGQPICCVEGSKQTKSEVKPNAGVKWVCKELGDVTHAIAWKVRETNQSTQPGPGDLTYRIVFEP